MGILTFLGFLGVWKRRALKGGFWGGGCGRTGDLGLEEGYISTVPYHTFDLLRLSSDEKKRGMGYRGSLLGKRREEGENDDK